VRRVLTLTLLVAALTAPATGVAGTTRATWERLDTGRSAPSARADAALAATSSRTAYLHGGERNGRPLGDLWRLDVRRERWSQMRPRGAAPRARFGHDLVATRDGTLLLFGGQSGSDFFGDVWRYDPRRNAWTQIDAPGPAPRYGAGVAYDRSTNALWVTHGFTNDGRFDDTWELGDDGFADASATPGNRPLERCLVGAAFRSGKLYLFGGQSDPRPFLDDLWRYDAAARTWEELQPALRPSARNVYGSALLGRNWVIHGGATRRGFARDLWVLDLARTSTFARVRTRGRAPAARANHAMTPLGRSRALIVGGAAEDGDQLRDAWLLRIR
jgi:hypothetical protein